MKNCYINGRMGPERERNRLKSYKETHSRNVRRISFFINPLFLQILRKLSLSFSPLHKSVYIIYIRDRNIYLIDLNFIRREMQITMNIKARFHTPESRKVFITWSFPHSNWYWLTIHAPSDSRNPTFHRRSFVRFVDINNDSVENVYRFNSIR